MHILCVLCAKTKKKKSKLLIVSRLDSLFGRDYWILDSTRSYCNSLIINRPFL